MQENGNYIIFSLFYKTYPQIMQTASANLKFLPKLYRLSYSHLTELSGRKQTPTSLLRSGVHQKAVGLHTN